MTKRVVLVSACLLGVRCRYDGDAARADELLDGSNMHAYIPVCPEQLGGLTTPRDRSLLKGGDGHAVLAGEAAVVMDSGMDVTAHFMRGAKEVLGLARRLGAREAVFKDRSPSCGVKSVHQNTGLTEGVGVTTALLSRNGIEVRTLD